MEKEEKIQPEKILSKRLRQSNAAVSVFISAFVLMSFSFMQKAEAQYYTAGEEPARCKWSETSSEHFTIIYPSGFSPCKNYREVQGAVWQQNKRAQNYLFLMEKYYGGSADSLGFTSGLTARFPMVFHPYNASSNGVTIWAPRQIDFYSMQPASGFYPQRWDEQLVMHEGRHAWQMAHFTKGIYKYLYWIMGDQITGAAGGIYPSRWMLEGDAVVAETEMSSFGRGRTASFLAYYWQDTKFERYGRITERSWDNWRFGSVKYYTPDAYALGYLVNSAARYETKDYRLTDKILTYEARHFWNPNVVARAFETYAGKSHKEFATPQAIGRYKNLLEKESDKKERESGRKQFLAEKSIGESVRGAVMLPVTARRSGYDKGYYIDCSTIISISPDSAVTIVNGYGSAPYLALYYRDHHDSRSGASGRSSSFLSAKEFICKPLRYFYGSVSGMFYRNNKLWWSEIVRDKRWSMLQHSEIFSYSLKTGKTEKLKRGTWWFYPSDYNGDIAVAEFSPYTDSTWLAVVDKHNGRYLARKPFNGTIYESARMGDYEYVSAVLPEGGSCIFRISVNELENKSLSASSSVSSCASSGGWEKIYGPVNYSLGGLISCRDFLMFTSDISGANRLYAIGQKAAEHSDAEHSIKPKLVNIEGAGAFKDQIVGADYAGNILFYSSMTDSRGVVPHAADFMFSQMKEETETGDGEKKTECDGERNGEPGFVNPVAEELSRQCGAASASSSADASDTNTVGNCKVKEYSKLKNLFHLHSWAPVYYNVNSVTAGSYDSFFEEAAPGVTVYSQNRLGTAVSMLGYSYLSGRSAGHAKFTYSGFYPVIEAEVHYNDRSMVKCGEHSLRGYVSAYVPLRFNTGGWLRGVTPEVSWSYRNDQKLYNMDLIEENVSRHQAIASVRGYCMLPVATAQIYPKWGIGAVARAGFNPSSGDKFGSIYSGYIYGYVPGILWNQGLRLEVGFQYQDVGNHKYWLSNVLDMPRGIDDDYYGKNYWKVSADYAIPIYLGDVSLGPVAYLKRLQLIPFADYARIRQRKRVQSSGGSGTSSASYTYKWKTLHSIGADVLLDGNFFRIGFPVSIGVRYANNGGRDNYAALLFAITFN